MNFREKRKKKEEGISLTKNDFCLILYTSTYMNAEK
jgi:hypothetical protein